MAGIQSNWKKRIILFFVSQCITLFGSQIVQMAIVWYVTLQTNSGAWVAAFSVCSYLPQFFVSFIGGVWADRYNRKYLIIGADALIAIVTLAMLLAMPYIAAEPMLLTALLVMSIIRSAGAGIQNPAVNAVIPQLVPKENLMRYNGINATMQSVVQFGGSSCGRCRADDEYASYHTGDRYNNCGDGISVFSLIPLQTEKITGNANYIGRCRNWYTICLF